MRKLAAGNWKMNGTAASLAEVAALIAAQPDPSCEMLLCPPATLISAMAQAARGSGLQVGAQDCHPKASGAHTGDLSAPMLADAGASHVILGHSERRAAFFRRGQKTRVIFVRQNFRQPFGGQLRVAAVTQAGRADQHGVDHRDGPDR